MIDGPPGRTGFGARSSYGIVAQRDRQFELQGRLVHEVRHRDSQQAQLDIETDVAPSAGDERLGDLGQRHRRAQRRRQRHRARHRSERREADADRHRSPGTLLGPQPDGDAIGEVTKDSSKEAVGRDPSPERRLRADGASPTRRLDDARIVVARQIAKLRTDGGAEEVLERVTGHRRQIADGRDTALRKPRPGDRPDAPHQPDR